MKTRLPVLLVALFSMVSSPLSATAEPQLPALDILGYFKNAEAWSKAPDAFLIENRYYGFQFLDAERNSAFSPETDRIHFGRFRVYETRIYWKDGAIRRVEVSIYNKGDAGLSVPKDGTGIYEILTGGAEAKDAIRETGTPGLDVIPSSVALSGSWPGTQEEAAAALPTLSGIQAGSRQGSPSAAMGQSP